MQGQGNGDSNRVVLVPCPLQGHINPMLQIASLLYTKGFSITIIHTLFNSPHAADYPHFDLKPMVDGLEDVQESNHDVLDFVSAFNTKSEVPFRNYVAQMVHENKIVCIISDSLAHFTQAAADEFKLPRLILRSSSANSVLAFMAFPILMEKGYLPMKDSQLEEPVLDLPPLRVKDLPEFETKDRDALYKLVYRTYMDSKHSSGQIWNSLDYLEHSALTKIQEDFQIPVFTIGPLHKHAPSTSSSSMLVEDRSCMVWLDKQAPNSVTYVSFGSLASIDRSQFIETAWGLANSKLPFLWVVRPNSVRGMAQIELPEGFEEVTSERGRVVVWAPQQEVLAHPAVGGFWTHSGWNSVLESIYEGVPMICWPCFGDQRVNARFVSHVWKVGVQLENGLERTAIEKTMRRLMVDKEGDEISARIKILMENARSCLRGGGSSCESLNRLADYMLSL